MAGTPDGPQRRHWWIQGRVQGVGFRWFVQREGERLALDGWVRNLPDGRVECAAEGSPEALARLDEALGKGPPSARVEQVECREEDASGGGERGFRIR